MSARVPMRSTGAEQAVVAKKGSNEPGAKGLPHCAGEEATTVSGDTDGRIAAATAKAFPIKYKRLKRHRRRAEHCLARIARKETWLFAHWKLLWGQSSMGGAG